MNIVFLGPIFHKEINKFTCAGSYECMQSHTVSFRTMVSVIQVLKCLGGRVLEIYDPREFRTIVSVIQVLKCLGGRVLEIYDPRELM